MKTWKWLAMLMAAVMLSALLPTLALAEAPVKLTAIYVKHPLTQEFSKMEWLRQAEEIAGVDIEWQEISADWEQIKSTMFASGDIPDLLFTATNDADYSTFVGLFEDLAPMINETDTPNITAFFSAHPEAETLARMADGKIYGLPKYQRFWPKVATSNFINKQWLDNLGLEIPTTWEELKDVLIAFRDGDPNGNGDTADEFPMDFLGSGLGQYHPVMLLGSTGIQLVNFFQDGYFAEDATVKNVYTDPRYKEFILFLRDLYAENLINPETWTNDYSTYQSVARGNGTEAKVGVTWGWEATDRFGLELADQYVALPPLKTSANDDRDVKVEYDFIGLNYDKNRVAMSANCKDKAAALRFIDTLYNPEFGIQILWGGMNDIDKCIAKNEDGSYTILPPSREGIDWGTWKWTMAWADGGPIYIADDMVIHLGEDMVDTLKQREVYNEYTAKVDEKSNMFCEMYMKYSAEDQATMAVNRTNIVNLAEPNMVAWITGAQDIEAEWDAYVENLYAMGLTENLQIKQAAYDEWLKTLE